MFDKVSCSSHFFIWSDKKQLIPLDKLQLLVIAFFKHPAENIFSDREKLQDYCFTAIVKEFHCFQSVAFKKVANAFRNIVGCERSVYQTIIEEGSCSQVENFLKALWGCGERQKWLRKHLTCSDYPFALHFAVRKNRPELISKLSLIQERNGRNPEGKTPLHVAISSGAAECLAILLKIADVSLELYCPVNNPKWGLKKPLFLFPISLSVALGKIECLDLLVENTNYKTCLNEIIPEVGNLLHLAIQCSELKMLKHLLTKHLHAIKPLINDAKSCPIDGYTPLSFAAICGNLEAMCLLYLSGADLDWKDREGRTALHHAAIQKQDEAARLLLFLGAKADLRDLYAKDAMYYAHGNFDVEQLLANAIQGLYPICIDFTSFQFTTIDFNLPIEPKNICKIKSENSEKMQEPVTIIAPTVSSFRLKQLSPLPKEVIQPGFYVLGQCSLCPAVNPPIWKPRGFGTFYLEDILYTSTCGICKIGKIKVKEIGIYDSSYVIEGELAESEQIYFQQNAALSKKMKIFGSFTWNYLIIKVINLDL